jgi:archaellin
MARSFRKYAWKKGTKGSIGIGTLIVFIALVLTAAIASAVILRVAYDLKNRAESVGLGAGVEVSGGLKILDITGDRSSVPPAATINRVTFLATIYAGNPGINVAKLRVHWEGPTQNVVLNLNTASPTVASATDFACDEVPVKAPRTSEWDPNAVPPTFFLVQENVIYITIDLTPLNGINDPLGAGKTASVYFEGVPGLVAYESFTTPFSYGTNRYIDLTMQ